MPRLRWWTLFSVLLIALVAFAAACGDDDDDDDATPTAGGDATPTAGGDAGFDESKMGGEITIQAIEFESFDPHFSSFAQDLAHEKQVFRGLYQLDKENNPRPEMAAAEPEISEDGMTYTIKLKDGLTWSDGTPLTAKDFVLGFERTCSYLIAGGYQYVISNVVGCDEYYDTEANTGKSEAEIQALRDGLGVKAIDDQTLEIQLETAQPTFTLILTMWPTWPVPSHIVADPAAEWPAPTDLVFNGPFKVESYSPGESMVFVRNDAYKGSHLAYLDKVTYRYIDDNAVADDAYRNGELQMALVDSTQFQVLEQEFPDEFMHVAAASTTGLQMQMEKAPLDNLDVRMALARAIDRQTLNEAVLQGAQYPTTTWIPADVAGIDPTTFDDVIGYNPEEAKKHLEAAGYPNGEGFPKLTILIRDSAANKALAEFLQGQYKEILNIDIGIEIVDGPTRSARFRSEDFELYPGGWNQDYPDAENWILGLYDTDGGLNHYNCSMPEIDSLAKAAQYNTNNEERKQQYRDINKLIVENSCGITPIYHQANNYLVSSKLGGAREFSNSNDYVLAADWIGEEWYLKK